MKTIRVSRDLLLKALASEISKQTAGLAEVGVDKVYGVVPSGEIFEIHGIDVTVAPKVRTRPASANQASPAGLGKIRLATVEGERV